MAATREPTIHTDPLPSQAPPIGQNGRSNGVIHRVVNETKSALKTTEFALTVIVILAILIASALISGGDTGGAGSRGGAEDEFIARQAWLYVAIITSAYVIGRGLAKSGTPESDDSQRH